MCFKTEMKFEIKENVTPVFRPKRNIPFSSLDSINKELERLEKLSVISRVDHSDWTSPTVYVKKKNNRIRVRVDFSTDLNDCLKDHSYLLPSHEDIFTKLNGVKYTLK